MIFDADMKQVKAEIRFEPPLNLQPLDGGGFASTFTLPILTEDGPQQANVVGAKQQGLGTGIWTLTLEYDESSS